MTLPKVSCIMPCGYGDKYVWTAAECWFDQTYEGPLELVIVDNNEDDTLSFMRETPLPSCVVYVRSPKMPVGALRNLGTSHATGEVCINWDEDDWSHPDRVKEQVKRLLESGKAVTGWHSILFYDMCTVRAYKYSYEPSGRNHPPYAMGTSQCYLKSWWEKHKFPENQTVEDLGFQQEALYAGQLDSCDAGQLCVVRAHHDSKCHPQFVGKQFVAVSGDYLPREFYDACVGKKQ
jgi:glycosyltransferase involved in cell wall biosynthesis